MLHRLKCNICECELPTRFTFPFCYEPHPYIEVAAREVISLYSQQLYKTGAGKMMGVLLVRDNDGDVGYLAAYSGEFVDGQGFFVPPIVDYLAPDGYFKIHENEISAINHKISSLEDSDYLAILKDELVSLNAEKGRVLAEAKDRYKQNKAYRSELRSKGNVTFDDEQKMIRESQFEKAEIHRIEVRYKTEIAAVEEKIDSVLSEVESLKNERRAKSENLQGWLFQQYQLLNARGEVQCVDDIFSLHGCKTPPSGSGDCCAPRLLQYAYQHSFKPLAMGEFWVGPRVDGSLRTEGRFYPSCQKRCKPILSFMLQGLDVEPNPLTRSVSVNLPVVYEDEWIVVVNKPGGLQSVPGLTSSDSVASRLAGVYPSKEIVPAHRLDQFTSGLLVVAKDREVLAAMHRLFENREVKKRYVALLEEKPARNSGTVSLPIGYDAEDSCRRAVDKVNGKEALTRYRVIGERMGYPLVEFRPETGRTHQLRIHSAHSEGLASPILGDSLYGTKGDKMHLCSCAIKFIHPVTADLIDLELKESEWFL